MHDSNASPEAELIRTAQRRDDYDTFRPILKDQVVLEEARAVLEDIGAWYDANPEASEIDWATFLAWAKVAKRAAWKPDKWDVYETITRYAASLKAPNPAIIDRFRELTACAHIRATVDEIVAGKRASGLLDVIRHAEGGLASGVLSGPELVSDDFVALLAVVTRTGGLEWRLEDLNRAVGPLGRGDLVMVGKRPEVGGTTFICSEITHMVAQLPPGKHALICNNEESGEKVKVRAIQAAINATVAEIALDPVNSKKDYETALRGHRVDVFHKTSMTTGDIERKCRSGEYALIAINVLDKLGGFSKLEGVERIRALGIWARGLADKYGVVFAVLQADASAEGEKWPDQSQLYGSKTGLQGEADVLIMIGATHNPADAEKRFIGVVKNKLPGGPKTIPSLRHGRFEVKFHGERARFHSLAYVGGKAP